MLFRSIKQIDDPDLFLWVIWALQQFYIEDKEKFIENYSEFLFEIIDYILSNRHKNLVFNKDNALLSTYGREVAVSWMNAMIDNRPVVPRSGYLVEFNSLWYNALKFAAEVANEIGNHEKAALLEEKSDLAGKSFINTFMNDAGYLYDYVDGYYKDPNVRPNMIFAVSLPYSPLEKRQKKSVIDFVTKELLTNCGLRSISPKSEKFRPHFSGTENEKKFAYFNGMAFPWLLGHYIEAYINVFHMSGLSLADRIMVAMENEIQNDCIGTISEFYDSNPPFIAHGGYSFAMSVAELLRAKRIIKSYK